MYISELQYLFTTTLCCKLINKKDEYLHYLKKACKLNPIEAKNVLGEYFPKGLEPENYYNYIIKNKS